MRDALRRLADVEPGDLPVLSMYLDLRPQATGEAPAMRSGLVVLKDRLREIEKTFPPRGDGLDSFCADVDRIERFLADDLPAVAQGLALFACAGRDLFETVEAGVAFDNQVSAGPAPDLFQLAGLLDEQETSVVAVVDSNTARLFVARVGRLREVEGEDEDSKYSRNRSSMGGWSQSSYQRHNAEVRTAFARDTAVAITQLVERENAVRVVLAGDEVAITPLRKALPPTVTALLEETLRIDIRTPRDEVAQEVLPLLAQAEADEAQTHADRLVEAVRGSRLAASGVAATLEALAHGRADLVLLDPDALEDATRSELVRLASTTGAELEIVEGHERLRRMGGVGALLRW